MLVVLALGGNALLRRGEPLDAETQRRNVAAAAGAIARVAAEHELVLTHGNGPQVGLLALQSAAYADVAPYPLDILGAESEGMIGYVLEQELGHHVDPGNLATVLTQVVVDPRDPAFANPTKPIGPVYPPERGAELERSRGWRFAPDGGGVRRVVPSPEPLSIVELGTIRLLVDAGVTVVCGGGGGIPVARYDGFGFTGVEAVIDKDLFASLLAGELGADALLLLTDVDAVIEGFGTSRARPIASSGGAALQRLGLGAGSMAPKVEAATRFVEKTGGVAAIGALDDADAVLRGERGTRIVPGGAGIVLR